MSDRFVPFHSSEGDGPPRGGFVGMKAEGGCESSHASAEVRPGAEDAQRPEPNIVLHRNGDTVVAIEVECPCGQRVVLSCDYGDGSSN